MRKILVVIANYNAKRHIKECIESIRCCLENVPYKVVVVDNASNDGAYEWLSEQKDLILVRNEENIGFGPACNQGVLASKGTEFEAADVFLLNNDTILNKNSVPNLMRALDKADDIGAVSPVSNYAGNRQQLEISFDTVEEYISFGENLTVPETDRYIEKVRLNGFAMLIKRKLWDEIGGFDEDFAPGYYEDDALSMEILRRGYRLLVVRDSFIYHVGSASFVKTGKNTLAYDHYRLFIKKYGFDILKYVYPCGAVISQIPFKRDDEFSLLQIGSGLGAELKAIRSLFPKAGVYGVEENTELYDISRWTEKVYSNIEEACNELSKGKETDSDVIRMLIAAMEAAHSSMDIIVIDSEFLSSISESQREKLLGICDENTITIVRNREYEDYPFDDIRLLIWDTDCYDQVSAEMLKYYGIMSVIYEKDIDRKLDASGIKQESMLFLTNDEAKVKTLSEKTSGIDARESAIVPYLTAHFARLKQSDPERENVRDFAMFEKRYESWNVTQAAEISVSNNANFAGEAEKIHITINRNCLERIDDILKLIKKASFTRDSIYNTAQNENINESSYITRLVSNDWNESAYIEAGDDIGDMGIVGFYCYNHRENRLLCKSFSWSVSGMGIEEYVLKDFADPSCETANNTVKKIHRSYIHNYQIVEDTLNAVTIDPILQKRLKILLIGPESLLPIERYLIGGSVTSEYFGKEKDDLPTKLYSGKYHVIVKSLFADSYDEWEKDGDAKMAQMLDELERMRNETIGNPAIILILGSDKDKKLSELYLEINPVITEFASDHDRMFTIDVADLIRDESDYGQSINEFSTRVYSDITERIVAIINAAI